MNNRPSKSPSGANLPLSEPVFLILLSLAAGEKHGYAILKDVENLSRQRLILSTSTLYGALARLEEQGLIEHVPASGPPSPGLPRKVFQLSTEGRRILAAETARMHDLAAAAQQRLAGQG